MYLPRFSLAQVLIMQPILAICCGCAAVLLQIWQHEFRGNVLDVRVSSDGATVAIAMDDESRCRVLSCDAESGLVLRIIELAGAERKFVRIAGDCNTWA